MFKTYENHEQILKTFESLNFSEDYCKALFTLKVKECITYKRNQFCSAQFLKFIAIKTLGPLYVITACSAKFLFLIL